MPPLGDILGLLALAAAGLAIWLARRRGSARVAAAIAAARADAAASAETALYARIGSSVVVNNTNAGHGVDSRAVTAHYDDYGARGDDDDDHGRGHYDYDRAARLDDDRAARILDSEHRRVRGRVPGFDRPSREYDGVPVGLRVVRPGRSADADGASTVDEGDESLRPLGELLDGYYDEATGSGRAWDVT